ncbi:MAG: AraC family transcriptional regulator [Prevotellaceae bacterium]|jgi:AraC-like DNA-binding protein|nr:AraC family transcriptional regulator [Prevotellaceae bacterium]
MIVFVAEKYKQIEPADVYVSIEQFDAIRADRDNGIPHPEITSIRLTGNDFFNLFATIVEEGVGLRLSGIAKAMGVKPGLLGPAIEAMSGLTAYQWVVQYQHMSACDKLRTRWRVSDVASSLGFSVSGFSHFFYRMENCSPTEYIKARHRRSHSGSRRQGQLIVPSLAKHTAVPS